MSNNKRWQLPSMPQHLVGAMIVGLIAGRMAYDHARNNAEYRKIVETIKGSDTHVNFEQSIGGVKVPMAWSFLWWYSTSRPEEMWLRGKNEEALPESYIPIARRCQKLHFEEGASDAYVKRCLSANTRELTLFPMKLNGDVLADVGTSSPKLGRVEAKFLTLTSKSLAALIRHPKVTHLEISAETDDLSLIGELEKPSALRSLCISLTYDHTRARPEKPRPIDRIPEPGDRFDDDIFDRQPKGSFPWLKQCKELREITPYFLMNLTFLHRVGEHLEGVERLNLPNCGADVRESIAEWKRLRHLCIDGLEAGDADLAGIVKTCPQVQTLEIESVSEKSRLTAEGLNVLTDVHELKRLRLARCHLTRAHFEEIAKLRTLEEISIEDPVVDDAAVEPLAKLPKLRRISLERTKATMKSLPAIRGDWDENRAWWAE